MQTVFLTTDHFLVRSDKSQKLIYFWNIEKFSFRESTSFLCFSFDFSETKRTRREFKNFKNQNEDANKASPGFANGGTTN